MKKTILLFSLILLSFNGLFADQLAYISKKDAESAAKLIKGKKVILFCGCCDNEKPIKVKVIDVKIEYTNYEQYYEVIISYKNAKGELVSQAIDLAYVWLKLKKKTQTVGQALKLEHDPCSDALKWKI